MDRDVVGTRGARLDAETIQREGAGPQRQSGSTPRSEFLLRVMPESPAATELSQGVSTLPSIQKHACIAQIVDLHAQRALKII
jgi:hypothetical protein